MKNVLRSVAVMASMGCSVASFANNAVLVDAPVEKIFVPQGFDDNDKVEVIVHGHFTSSCYKMGPVNATVNKETKVVSVRAEAYYYPGAVCMQMMVPFIKSVELTSSLPAGTYKVEALNRPETPSASLLVVHTTRPEADDFLYAGVQTAGLDRNITGSNDIVLRGNHPRLFVGCMKFVEVKSYLDSTNVLVIQPVTRIAPDEECTSADESSHFEQRVTLESPLAPGEYLLHVRALDGNAVNQLLVIE